MWPGSSQLLAWMVRGVWPGSSQLLGWLRLYGLGSSQLLGLGSSLGGSGCMAGQLLGWFRLYGQGLVSCSGCVAGV